METHPNIEVLVLSDTPVDESPEIVQASAYLISAAKHDKLVSVVCTHDKSGEPATILCALIEDKDKQTAQYIPLAMLFSEGNTPWVDYNPPKAALNIPEPGPMDVFDEEQDEPESEETS